MKGGKEKERKERNGVLRGPWFQWKKRKSESRKKSPWENMKQVFLPLCPLNLNLKPETDVQVNRLHIEKGEEQRENFSLRKLKSLCLE